MHDNNNDTSLLMEIISNDNYNNIINLENNNLWFDTLSKKILYNIYTYMLSCMYEIYQNKKNEMKVSIIYVVILL